MITAEILADSINPAGDRITTGLWTYPRFIHSEIMTHRMLAKNSASSRAIPVSKMMAAVRDTPAMFEQYGMANKGMEAHELMGPAMKCHFQNDWKALSEVALSWAETWDGRAAKQLVNRALEPWMWMTIVITGTDWHNFFALRAHPAADPTFQTLAYRWLDRYLKAKPVERDWGQWHLPFVPEMEERAFILEGDAARKVSVARCARVSYTTHNKEKTLAEDIAQHDRMLGAGHMSPFEHQACAENDWSMDGRRENTTQYHGCFKGWKPYRKFLPNENRSKADLHAILANKPDWVVL